MRHSPITIRMISATLLAIAALFTSSCSSIGPDRLLSSHIAYNDAVQLTVTREVLSNIVRSRYSDPMQFIAVGAINAQFSVSVSGSAGVGGIGRAMTSGNASADVGYSDSPTITYVPQSDAAFYKSFHSTFGIGEAVLFTLAYRAAALDPELNSLSLRFAYASINGASDLIGAEETALYDQRIEALARLLQLGATYQQIPEWDYDSMALPREKVTAEDKIEAFKNRLYFVEQAGGQEVRLARYRLVVALEVPTPHSPEVVAALRVLDAAPGKRSYVLRPPQHSFPGEMKPDGIWITPRSMSDIMGLAAEFVEVPDAHRSIVTALQREKWSGKRDSLPVIHSSRTEPAFPYRVQHRGWWFYVDDTDLGSKMLLEAMVAAYSSRVGSKQAGDEAPQVVIPVGGG